MFFKQPRTDFAGMAMQGMGQAGNTFGPMTKELTQKTTRPEAMAGGALMGGIGGAIWGHDRGSSRRAY